MADGIVTRAWAIAEQRLQAQHTPIKQGGIEISHGFTVEWDLAEMGQREKREWCEAWTLEGGEPRALMANLRGEQDDESNNRSKVRQGRGSRANLDTAQ